MVSLLDNKEKTFLAFSASFCLGGKFIGQKRESLFWGPFLLHSALVVSLLDNKEKTFLGAFSASFSLGGKFIGQ